MNLSEASRPVELPAFEIILWPIDLTSDRASLDAPARALASITRGSSASVEPVYVTAGVPEHAPPGWETEWHAILEHKAKRELISLAEPERELRDIRLGEPTILHAPRASVRVQVRELLLHARHRDADLIVVGTHGRSGMRRLWLGSFAETLLLLSPVPVLICSPQTQPSHQVKRILFPSDLSHESGEAFRTLLGLAHRMEAEIVLLHMLPPFFSTELHSAGAPPLPAPLIEKAAAECKAAAEPWRAFAREHGVALTIEIVPYRESLPAAIEHAATVHASDLIALASQTGPVASVLVGSVARSLARTAREPLLVLPTRAVATSGWPALQDVLWPAEIAGGTL